MSHSEDWNPRFSIYARLHGLDEKAMLERDRERFPGGGMAGFSLWIQRHVQAYAKAHPERHLRDVDGRVMLGTYATQEGFTAWLEAYAKPDGEEIES